MNRSQRYLSGLLLIQVVLILLFKSPLSSNTGSAQSHPLLPQLESLDAAKLEFGGRDGESLTVAREDGSWKVVEADGYPADAKKVQDLLDELKGLKVRRPVVSSERYHKAFKVTDDENEGTVKVYDAEGDEPDAELILGSSSNYMLNHVRVEGDDKVYEVRGLAPYDVRADAGTWIDKALVDVPAERVVGLTLTNSGGTLELAKQDGTWSLVAPAELADTVLDQDKVANLVRIARSLRVDSAAGRLDEAAQGFADPAATVTLKLAPAEEGGEPEQITVRVGSRLPDKETQRYVSRSGFDYAAAAWESSLKKLIEQAPGELASDEDESPLDTLEPS